MVVFGKPTRLLRTVPHALLEEVFEQLWAGVEMINIQFVDNLHEPLSHCRPKPRSTIIDAMLPSVKAKLEDVVRLGSKTSKEFSNHVAHAVEQYR